MCGIVAVVTPGAPIPTEILCAMRDRLEHRGPDGSGIWISETGRGSVGLGHRRLAIIDLSDAGIQPMFSADESLVIVYNGEIYNFVELRAELEQLGHAFRTRTDTEVLLAAYEQWGRECLPKLNGMFAFAIWDTRAQRLLVARDRFGEKPLFFTPLSNGGLAFASEMKALFAHPDVPVEPEERAIEAYTRSAYHDDGELTMFRGIYRFPAAHAAVVDLTGQQVRRWRYWTPDYRADNDGYDENAVVARFAELLDRSLSMRLRSDVPVGTSLSGGLDSSMVICLLARHATENPMVSLNAYSSRFDAADPTMSEGPEIDVVVSHAGVHALAVTPEPERLIEESSAVHWHQEEPFLSASIYAQWCVMRLVASEGTKVLLDGQGADELLGGYQYYFRTYQLDRLDRRQYLRLARETRAFTTRLRRAAERYDNSKRRFDSEIALSFAQLVRALVRRPSVYAGDYTIGVPPPRRGDRLRRQLAEALQYNSLPQLLRYADRNAMAFSRETRFPFLDYDLVDWCVSLPDEAFVTDGWQKWVLRRAGEGVLPAAIQWRADKVGYAAPLDGWLRGPLETWARERLFSGPVTELSTYRRPHIEMLWNAHQNGAGEHSWALWRWISLSEWFALLEQGSWNARTSHLTQPVGAADWLRVGAAYRRG
jgi:asparagine synthase (glutamine-hydrolysing)